jgi:hypothetical protein
MDLLDIIKLILMLGTISAFITGGAIYYTRKSVDTVVKFAEKQNRDIDLKTNHSVSELKDVFKENAKNTKEEYTFLVTHIDNRIDKIYNRMENNTQDLKEYVANEVTALKFKDHDQDVRIEQTKDKVHGISEALLKFKLEASEKYEKKNNT